MLSLSKHGPSFFSSPEGALPSGDVMPELPDIVVYLEALRARIIGQPLERIRLASPFLLRSVHPPVEEAQGKTVLGVRRLGKRLVFCLAGDVFLVLHLMIAGRLHWKPAGAKIPGRLGLAAFDFPPGSLLLTEAGSKKRASLHVVGGVASLRDHDPGGLEVLEADLATFQSVLGRENHTLKRALTDPNLFSGIGNAYSDEILHRARLSPARLTKDVSAEESSRLFHAARSTLVEWTGKLRREAGDGFPEHVTAFRDGMAVHGRYGKPCPDCGSPVQRVIYAETETNYCARCQTDGRLLSDRMLSRLLKCDWPRTLEELERKRVSSPGHACTLEGRP
jgi:formamidopyrimidine-DNA glycosylase